MYLNSMCSSQPPAGSLTAQCTALKSRSNSPPNLVSCISLIQWVCFTAPSLRYLMSGLDDASSDTWQHLVHEFRDKLGFSQPADSEGPTTCENDFRDTVTELCSDNRERNPHREIARFRRVHNPIISFVTAIDGTNKFPSENALQPLIWQLMTCAVKVSALTCASNLGHATIYLPRFPTGRLRRQFKTTRYC